ncbi:MAG: hypothetical protein U0736_14615 [Gemmataceae bacterium]
MSTLLPPCAGTSATSARSPRAIQQIGKGGITGQVDGEALERSFQRRAAVVADGGDVSAVEVAQHHRLEQIVNVRHRKRQIDAGVAVDRALALEQADAGGEQHHLVDRQAWPPRRLVAPGRRLVALLRRQQPGPVRHPDRRRHRRGSHARHDPRMAELP